MSFQHGLTESIDPLVVHTVRARSCATMGGGGGVRKAQAGVSAEHIPSDGFEVSVRSPVKFFKPTPCAWSYRTKRLTNIILGGAASGRPLSVSSTGLLLDVVDSISFECAGWRNPVSSNCSQGRVALLIQLVLVEVWSSDVETNLRVFRFRGYKECLFPSRRNWLGPSILFPTQSITARYITRDKNGMVFGFH